MFLSTPAKSFLAGVIFLLSTTGCGLMGTSGTVPATTVDELPSRIPFATREPETFQCDIIETAGGAVRRRRIAKMQTWRRVDFDVGEKTQRTLLQTDKEYVIEPARRVYAETEKPNGGAGFSELTHELMSTAQPSSFEETGRDGDMVSYLVRPADGDSSEIEVRFDESIGMPVSQQFFSTATGERTLRFKIEIINFRTEPDAEAFAIPNGFRKVSMSEFLNASK